MIRKLSLVAAFISSFLLIDTFAIADNINPRVSDPREHKDYMELAVAERYLHAAFKPVAIDKLQKLSAERPNWKKNHWIELELAQAAMFDKKLNQSLAMFERVRDTYRQSDPEVSALAQQYRGDCLNKLGRHQEAAEAFMTILPLYESLADPQPVIQCQKKLAYLLWQRKIDEQTIFGNAQQTPDVMAMKLSVKIALEAEYGDVQNAYKAFDELKSLLPAGDKRVSIAAVRLIASELYAYERSKDQKIVEHAKQMVSSLEATYPSETLLVSKSKLLIAGTLVRCRRNLPEAEKLCREALDIGIIPDRLPVAYSILAESLYAQKKYDDAAKVAKTVTDKYPYSTWADYASFFYAESLYKAGKKQQAIDAFEDVITTYPESSWAQAAKAMKGVFLK